MVRLPSAVSTAAMLVWTRESASDAVVPVAEPRAFTALSALETAPRTVWRTVLRAALLLQNKQGEHAFMHMSSRTCQKCDNRQ